VSLRRGEAEQRTYSEQLIDGHRVALSENLVVDHYHKKRIWAVRLNIDGIEYHLERYSAYLPHASFFELMVQSGFLEVRRQTVRGENYEVFIAGGRLPAVFEVELNIW
jgi:hypothetical protein